jgi:hypothetical protein
VEGEAGHLMSARLVAGLLVLLLADGAAQAASRAPICFPIPILDARRYENVDYQFAVVIPPGLRACKISSPCPNHGIWLPLSAHDTCNDDPHVPYVYVEAHYNAASETDAPTYTPARTPGQLARVECRYRSPARISWLPPIRLAGRSAAGCRQYFDDGRISLYIVTLRKTEAWAAQWIVVGVGLETTGARHETDMRGFHAVVKNLWIHPDGPLD